MYTSAIIFAEICFFWVNGLIVQWGYITAQAANVQNKFNIDFPNKCVSIFICSIRTSYSENSYDHVNSVTENGFKCLVINVPFFWIAIGY